MDTSLTRPTTSPFSILNAREAELENAPEMMFLAEAFWWDPLDRWLADRELVTREEFDAVRAMAQKAREENEALKARIEALEGKKK